MYSFQFWWKTRGKKFLNTKNPLFILKYFIIIQKYEILMWYFWNQETLNRKDIM